MIADFDILIVEDNPGDTRLLQEYLRSSHHIETSYVTSLAQALERLNTQSFNIVLLDLSLPDSQGLETFQHIHTVAPETAIVVLTGLDDDAVALQAMRQGAQDYLSKNQLDARLLVQSLRYAVERKRSELALRESERFARSTINALAKHIAVLDENGTILEVNKAWRQFATANNADLDKVGVAINYLDVCDAVTGEDADTALQFATGIRAVMSGQLRQFSLEYPCHSPTEKRWFNARATRFEDDGPLRLVVSHEDITERKQAEIELMRSEELHRMVLSSISDAVFITTDSGEFTYLCPNVSTIFGHTQEEVSSFMTIQNLLGQVSYDRDILATRGEIQNLEHQVTDKSGHLHTLLINVKSVNIDEGTILYTCRDITEHQQAVAALHDSEGRYRALFDHSLNPVFIHDFDGNFIDANQAALDLLGYQRDDLSQLNFMALLQSDDVSRAMQLLQTIFQLGYQREASEFQLRRKDNTRIDVETMSSVIYRKGEPWAIQGIARDITEQKHAHAEERARRIIAEALQETTTAILSGTLDLDEMLEQILEYTVSLIPCDAATLMQIESGVASVVSYRGYYEEDVKKIMDFSMVVSETSNLREIAKTRQPYIVSDTHEFSGWRKDKLTELSIMRSNLSAPIIVGDQLFGLINLDSKTPSRFTKQHADQLAQLTNQAAIAIHNAQLYEQIHKHAIDLEKRVIERTQQLQRAKDRVEAILNSSNDALVLADIKGVIFQTNPGFNAQFYYEPEALFGQSLTSLIAPESLDALHHGVQEVLQEKTSTRLEVVAVRQNQTTFPADVLISSIAEDGVVGVLCSLRDITLQKQVEADLREALEKEKELNDLKTQFTSIVSHEFRTPLTVILSTAEMLLNYHDRIDPERRLTKLKNITQQVQRLTHLMDEVLMGTRAETVGFEFKPKRLNLITLCERIIQEVQVRHDNGVSIDFLYDDECREETLDEFLFSHILQNLVSNAVKYSTEGGTVQIQLSCSGQDLMLQVKDQGIGIPLEHQEKIFESFQRASNVGNIQGTGIGMTIVKRAVDAHGGTIEFESTEGQGTIFIVMLPINTFAKNQIE